MRISAFPLSTVKEVPAEAEIVSHRLMLRAGLIRRLSAGLYTWMPYGLRVLRKVEAVVREEMNAAGAVELLMPAVQPAELWEETGRWEQFGPQLLKMRDRNGRDFCFGPTHEEVITDLCRRELKSYRQLPVNYYQIQTKFRDEIRPRFGVMRAREFLMKDAYSFHVDEHSLREGYDAMYDAYTRIFTRLGLGFRAVEADTGAIGGSASHEFHVLADSGEDAIAFSDSGSYAANVELAATLPAAGSRPAPAQDMARVDTPGVHTIADLSAFLDIAPEASVKTLIATGEDDGLVALVLRGDHELNAVKAGRLPGVAEPLQLAASETIVAHLGCAPGSIGPVGLNVPVYVDHAAAALADFACGANTDDVHLTGVNWGRDCPEPESIDLRNARAGDPSPDGQGTLHIARGIEVGHVFMLGSKYSEAMGATVLGEDGEQKTLQMGCYGIGVSRIVAAAIEQNHDERGIVWPLSMAPFTVAIVPIAKGGSTRVAEVADALYAQLVDAGIEVLMDDRDARPGVKFADIELIGIPYRIVVSERGLDAGTLEVRGRRDPDNSAVPTDDVLQWLRNRMAEDGCAQPD